MGVNYFFWDGTGQRVEGCRKCSGETAELAWVVGKRKQKPGNEASTFPSEGGN